jgi:sensor histidine kinase YesM
MNSKQLISIAAILLAIFFASCQKPSPKDEKWDYFKQVVFGYDIDRDTIQTLHIFKNESDTLKFYINSTKDDSLVLVKILKDMNPFLGRTLRIVPLKEIYVEESPNKAHSFEYFLSIQIGSSLKLKDLDKWTDTVIKKDTYKALCDIASYRYPNKSTNQFVFWKANMSSLFINSKNVNQLQKELIMKKAILYAMGLGSERIAFKSELNENNFLDLIPDISHFDYKMDYVHDDYSTFLEQDTIHPDNNLSMNYLNDSYPKSFLNPKFTGTSELSELDKYVIKTYTSKYLTELIKTKRKLYQLQQKNESSFEFKLQIIKYIIFSLLLLCLLFGLYNYFKILSYISKEVKNIWLAFNYKILVITGLMLIPLLTFTILEEDVDYQKVFGVVLSGLLPIFLLSNLLFFLERETLGLTFAKRQIILLLATIIGSILATLPFSAVVHNGGAIVFVAFLSFAFASYRFFQASANLGKEQILKEKDLELTRLQELKSRAELNALRSKINPHFLYNALNSIAGLAYDDPAKVETMALALSKSFRHSLNKDNSDFGSLVDEMEMVQIYLDIEKVRLGEKLNYAVSMPQNADKLMIPKFIIQPLVENAIKHGISAITEPGRLKIEVTDYAQSIEIAVFDNGPDFQEGLGTGFGLHSICDTLDILYPAKYRIDFTNGTNKHIKIVLNK